MNPGILSPSNWFEMTNKRIQEEFHCEGKSFLVNIIGQMTRFTMIKQFKVKILIFGN